jgi:hypothetical protein
LVLVLCEEFGHAAGGSRLRERGVVVKVVTGADFAATDRWEHRIGATGTMVAIQLADGRHVVGSETHGVLNRLSSLPVAWVQRISRPDRDYAVQEMYALSLCWLHALPGPVINPPAPQGRCDNCAAMPSNE